MTLETIRPSAPLVSKKNLSLEIGPAKGLGLTGIKDSITPLPKTRSNTLKGLSISLVLYPVCLFAWGARSITWIFKKCLGYTTKNPNVYGKLYKMATSGDHSKIEAFLKKITLNERYYFSEIFRIHELHPHLTKILEGANICLANDGGTLFNKWKQHPQAKSRSSSHNYQKGQCYAIEHFLFWLDPNGNTRFQLEKSPLKGFCSRIEHLIDYLRYKRDHQQQGVVGTSPHTEDRCLSIEINTGDFV